MKNIEKDNWDQGSRKIFFELCGLALAIPFLLGLIVALFFWLTEFTFSKPLLKHFILAIWFITLFSLLAVSFLRFRFSNPLKQERKQVGDADKLFNRTLLQWERREGKQILFSLMKIAFIVPVISAALSYSCFLMFPAFCKTLDWEPLVVLIWLVTVLAMVLYLRKTRIKAGRSL